MSEYEQHHHDKELLASSSLRLGDIEVSPASDLEQVRNIINRLGEDQLPGERLAPDWCFVDCKYNYVK